MAYRYVFGPVTSSRLGLSLGLDLLGRPVCSMDCLYCEVGRTEELTLGRAPYVAAAELLDELRRWRQEHPEVYPDHVTLGGMGEPCLNSQLAEIIAGTKDIFPHTPVAVLTNASLLTDPAVRTDLARADVVLPSLDSLVAEEFRRLNRPAGGLTPEVVARGILDFAASYQGRIFLEILLVAGVNDSVENLERLRTFLGQLRPQRVDVVTMTRAGAYPTARPVAPEVLAAWRQALGGGAQSAPRTSAAPLGGVLTLEEIQEKVADSIARRPQSAADLARGLGMAETDAAQALAALVRQGRAVDLGGQFRAVRTQISRP